MNENLVLRYAPEYWADVEGYEGIYQASNHGKIRSLDRVLPYGNAFRKYKGKELKQHLTRDGYLYVNTVGKKQRKVHRLVLYAFLGASDLDVHHINEVKTDNNLCNLMYMDTTENTRIATARLHPNQVREIKRLIREGVSNTDIGKFYGVNHRTIFNIKAKNTWKHIA